MKPRRSSRSWSSAPLKGKVRIAADFDELAEDIDRLPIAQALHEGFRLVTRDVEIAKYPVLQILA